MANPVQMHPPVANIPEHNEDHIPAPERNEDHIPAPDLPYGFPNDYPADALIDDEQYAVRFDEVLHSHFIHSPACDICKERWFDIDVEVVQTLGQPEAHHCKTCRRSIENRLPNMFSVENDADPGPQPQVLKDLTYLEQQLIAKVHPVMSIYSLQRTAPNLDAQLGYRGNVVNFAQDVFGFATRLPIPLRRAAQFVYVRRQQGTNYKDFLVRPARIFAALYWLRDNNIHYRDIEIDENALHELDTAGGDQCVVEHLSRYQNEAEQQQHPDLLQARIHDGDIAPLFQPISQPSDACGPVNVDEEEALQYGVQHSSAIQIQTLTNRQSLGRVLRLGPDENQPQQQAVPVVDGPEIIQQPLDEFNTEGLIGMAFPTLFPTGAGDLNSINPNRFQKIPTALYFQHLMKYHDRRFAQHPAFCFYAMNSVMRWSAMKNATICLKQNSLLDNVHSVEQLRERLQDDVRNLKDILSFNQNIRTTAAYWAKCSRQLREMIENPEIGYPTFFVTFTAADLHWNGLDAALSENGNHIPNANVNEPERLRRRAASMKKNPMASSYYFMKRAEIFIKEVLMKKFPIREYWYRVEFQKRGAPHLHCLFWFRDAPDLRNLTPANASAERLEAIRRYYDQYCTAEFHPQISPVNPRLHRPHPCRINYSSVGRRSRSRDLTRILRSVQMHRCSANQCLAVNRPENNNDDGPNRNRHRRRHPRNQRPGTCKADYPKEVRIESSLTFDEHGTLRYLPKRNQEATFICNYNKTALQIFRASIDWTPITHLGQIIGYISKYVSKSANKSRAMYAFMRLQLANPARNDSVKRILRKILIRMVGERDYSAQEVFYFLMGWKLYSSSRQFAFLFVGRDEYIRAEIDNQNDQVVRQLTQLEVYQQRTVRYERYSLRQFFALLFKSRYAPENAGGWKRRDKFAVLQVAPNIRFNTCEGANNDLFWHQRLLLDVPWREPAEIQPIGHETFLQMYNRLIVNAVAPTVQETEHWNRLGAEPRPMEARSPYLNVQFQMQQGVDRILQEDDAPPEQQDDGNQDEIHNADGVQEIADFMQNAAIDPQLRADEAGIRNQIGFRPIDLQFDWSNSYNQLPPFPADMQNFVARERRDLEAFPNNRINAPNNDANVPVLRAEQFSFEQARVVNIFEHQLQFLQRRDFARPTAIPENLTQLTFVQGKAGSGKSAIIHYIRSRLTAIDKSDSICVVAPTGIAALNVNGSTIQSRFAFGRNATIASGFASSQFTQSFEQVRFLIVDESSMVGLKLLSKLHTRCLDATNQPNLPFGGFFVFFFGDIRQLPPVIDQPMYRQIPIRGSVGTVEQLAGRTILNSFNEFVFLNTVYRQQGHRQQLIRDILERVSIGQCTEEDLRTLYARSILRMTPAQKAEFENATHLFYLNEDAKSFNNRKLRQTGLPICRIKAKHTQQNIFQPDLPQDPNSPLAFAAEAKEANGLEAELLVSIGTRVMLRNNLCVSFGLVNGAVGVVRHIVMQANRQIEEPEEEILQDRERRPHVIMVEFQNYTGPMIHNCVPIPMVKHRWRSGQYRLSREQFPLMVAFAISIHKSQGLGFDRVVIDLGQTEDPLGLAYVAMSRVKTLEGLAFYRVVNQNRLDSIRRAPGFQERTQFEQWMQQRNIRH